MREEGRKGTKEQRKEGREQKYKEKKEREQKYKERKEGMEQKEGRDGEATTSIILFQSPANLLVY